MEYSKNDCFVIFSRFEEPNLVETQKEDEEGGFVTRAIVDSLRISESIEQIWKHLTLGN